MHVYAFMQTVKYIKRGLALKTKKERYGLNAEDTIIFTNNLSKLFKFKKFSARVLYFDTLNNNDYNNAVNDIENRKELSIRIYSNINNEAFIILKNVMGNYEEIQKLKISKEDAILICKRIYTPLLAYKEEFAEQLYVLFSTMLYTPKCVIEYDRIKFYDIVDQTEISIDSNVKISKHCCDLHADNLPFVPLLELNSHMLELTINKVLLNYIKDIFSSSSMFKTNKTKFMLALK